MKDILIVKFLRVQSISSGKNRYDDDLNRALFLQQKVSKLIDRGGYFQCYDEPRGVLPAKTVEKLCPFMKKKQKRILDEY